jgi:hypothetical protein
MAAIITAASGFLISVLWFDLMFDVQVFRHRSAVQVPEDVLDSIARYYRRVTTTASPMGRLVLLVMLVLLGALIYQAATADVDIWVSVISFAGALTGIGLAGVRVFGRARRLGARSDPPSVQSELARSIFRDHLICLAGMVTVLAVQIGADV